MNKFLIASPAAGWWIAIIFIALVAYMVYEIANAHKVVEKKQIEEDIIEEELAFSGYVNQDGPEATAEAVEAHLTDHIADVIEVRKEPKQRLNKKQRKALNKANHQLNTDKAKK